MRPVNQRPIVPTRSDRSHVSRWQMNLPISGVVPDAPIADKASSTLGCPVRRSGMHQRLGAAMPITLATPRGSTCSGSRPGTSRTSPEMPRLVGKSRFANVRKLRAEVDHLVSATGSQEGPIGRPPSAIVDDSDLKCRLMCATACKPRLQRGTRCRSRACGRRAMRLTSASWKETECRIRGNRARMPIGATNLGSSGTMNAVERRTAVVRVSAGSASTGVNRRFR